MMFSKEPEAEIVGHIRELLAPFIFPGAAPRALNVTAGAGLLDADFSRMIRKIPERNYGKLPVHQPIKWLD